MYTIRMICIYIYIYICIYVYLGHVPKVQSGDLHARVALRNRALRSYIRHFYRRFPRSGVANLSGALLVGTSIIYIYTHTRMYIYIYVTCIHIISISLSLYLYIEREIYGQSGDSRACVALGNQAFVSPADPATAFSALCIYIYIYIYIYIWREREREI